METYRSTFPKKYAFLAVVHVEGEQQGLRNARIAQEEGADGIFLINHSITYVSLLECYARIRQQLPDFWIGLNCLDLGMSAVGVIPQTSAGLWVDNAGIKEGASPTYIAEQFAKLRKKSEWHGIYFGGVAFKYQAPVSDVAKVARLAMPFVDVITTSGDGTGIAADISKIRRMKEAIGNHPLAIASGITPENVSDYMPHADCFLVATGVSNSHTELNPKQVRKLAALLGK